MAISSSIHRGGKPVEVRGERLTQVGRGRDVEARDDRLPLGGEFAEPMEERRVGIDVRRGELATVPARVGLLCIEERVVAKLRPRRELRVEEAPPPRFRVERRNEPGCRGGDRWAARARGGRRATGCTGCHPKVRAVRVDQHAHGGQIGRVSVLLHFGREEGARLIVFERRERRVERVRHHALNGPVGHPIEHHVGEHVRVHDVPLAEQRERCGEREVPVPTPFTMTCIQNSLLTGAFHRRWLCASFSSDSAAMSDAWAAPSPERRRSTSGTVM